MNKEDASGSGSRHVAFWNIISRNRITAIAAAFALLGIALLGLWLLTNDGSSMSMLLSMAGIGIISLSVMLYFFSPSNYLRDTVCDAMAISDIMTINKVLSSLLVESAGIYIPGSDGVVKVFIPVSRPGENEIGLIRPGTDVFDVKGPVKGISLSPPGYGLFQHAVGIGAVFTPEGLESEVKDVIENGLELAASASVKREGGQVMVSLRDLVSHGMCRSIRAADPNVCMRTGCPICSFVACMIASGTGKKARLKSVNAGDRTINLTYELI
jgi:hypothetical protein